MEKCPECNRNNIKINRRTIDSDEVDLTEKICYDCGLIIEEVKIHKGCGGNVNGIITERKISYDKCDKCDKKWEQFFHACG